MTIAQDTKRQRILVRSGWQTVNIGDIGHTPGLLRLLEDHVPEADVTLWPRSVDRGVEPMLRRRFPKVGIVKGDIGEENKPTTEELATAFEEADFLLHGSGPGVVCHRDLWVWRRLTGKPYGIYGTTIEHPDDKLRDLLNGAKFVFTRDTKSITAVRAAGASPPVLDFAPDATFAIDLRNDEAALAYMKEHGLAERQFICAIPRLRKTPYYKIHPSAKWTKEKIREVDALNEKHKEADHAKMRDVIIRWVRETGMKVLVCPEMTYQVEIARPLLIDPLPDDVKRNVVHRDSYWLPDEAGSVYRRAHTVVSFECHSPIIAAAHGAPCFYLRQPTDTIKGHMYHDIGLSDWTFEIDEVQGRDIADRLMAVQADYPTALAYLAAAMNTVRRRQTESMAVVRQSVKA
ncbi:MAG: polysaccharide pyruvyl transferase family protein [Planctomycetota bacterium]